jgi:hypothetical protein
VTARPPALRALVLTTPPPARNTTPIPGAAAIAAPAPAPAPSFLRAVPALVMTPALHLREVAPAAFVPPPSGFHAKVAPELVHAARARRDAARLPKGNAQTYLVAGIWAMALSLFAILMFMATSA